ncbi:PmoA family protein [Kiritimatiella glycovorans]|uniref:Methane oxygenase PmoA n=1 Tax=Kiritimatiella glycovorans TaxID=1307763 RepID=A0A0G3ELN2_9BACT|nr:PmoA family protein [Kiritimatiella glycovorans]AKJ65064.1 hypothetical protein L21SP4_01827 [Kiritimatiella glycovorans]
MKTLLMTLTAAGLLIGTGTAGSTLDGSPWSWDKDPGKSLTLTGPSGVVCRLNFDADEPKPWIHPLNTTDGRTLTWLSPPDHPWHWGLWFSWKYINHVNFWEMNRKTGRIAGRTTIRNAEIVQADREAGVVRMTLEYAPRDREGEPWMRETRTIRIGTPRPDGSYRIDWAMRCTALSDLELGRNPKPRRGYGGFSFRGAKGFFPVTMRGAGGRPGNDLFGQRAPWASASGPVDGKTAAVAIFDHPSNPDHPAHWFVRSRKIGDGQPYTFLNPALLYEEDRTLQAGETMDLIYGVLVVPHEAEDEVLEAEFVRFGRETEP